MKKFYIIAASLVACIALYFVEQILVVDYITKTLVKVVLFVLIPYIYMKLINRTNIIESLNLGRIDASSFKWGILLGTLSFIAIFIAYVLLGRAIDFNNIVQELQSKSNITPSNFLWIGLYITFGNSFLEEFFFRGFIFLNLYHLGSRKMAYIYSSLLFGIYHIAIFQTWFQPMLIGLALLGLIIIGFIFNWLDTKTNNFINSWVVHILADSAIILIGMRMLHMI